LFFGTRKEKKLLKAIVVPFLYGEYIAAKRINSRYLDSL
jgi:hypothetical protein